MIKIAVATTSLEKLTKTQESELHKEIEQRERKLKEITRLKEEQAELNDHLLNKLYELLEEDVQELRASEQPI